MDKDSYDIAMIKLEAVEMGLRTIMERAIYRRNETKKSEKYLIELEIEQIVLTCKQFQEAMTALKGWQK